MRIARIHDKVGDVGEGRSGGGGGGGVGGGKREIKMIFDRCAGSIHV